MREVADFVLISESYYSMIESGQRDLSPGIAKKIAELLQFDWTKFYED